MRKEIHISVITEKRHTTQARPEDAYLESQEAGQEFKASLGHTVKLFSQNKEPQ